MLLEIAQEASEIFQARLNKALNSLIKAGPCRKRGRLCQMTSRSPLLPILACESLMLRIFRLPPDLMWHRWLIMQDLLKACKLSSHQRESHQLLPKQSAAEKPVFSRFVLLCSRSFPCQKRPWSCYSLPYSRVLKSKWLSLLFLLEKPGTLMVWLLREARVWSNSRPFSLLPCFIPPFYIVTNPSFSISEG